jgi:hypothetical protein
LRRRRQEDLEGLAASLSLYANTPFPAALAMPVSDASLFFETRTWQEKKKTDDARIKLASAILSGINENIRATGIVAKTIARKPQDIGPNPVERLDMEDNYLYHSRHELYLES